MTQVSWFEWERWGEKGRGPSGDHFTDTLHDPSYHFMLSPAIILSVSVSFVIASKGEGVGRCRFSRPLGSQGDEYVKINVEFGYKLPL